MQSNKCPSNVEKLREIYKPENIEVLLVGESPPKNRQRFFYCSNGSQLGYATREAFEEALQIMFEDFEDFLKSFRSRGFYLEDLFHIRGKKVYEASLDELREAVRELANRISLYRPRLVIAVLCRICECVKRAVIEAEINVPIICVPFPNPGGNHQRYIKGLVETLQLLSSGTPLGDKNYCSNKSTSKHRRPCLKILRELYHS